MRRIKVGAAVIFDRAGRVMVCSRPEGKPLAGGWEFPGGKLEPGESLHRALARELVEELGIHPLLLDVIMTDRVQAPDCEIELFFVRAFAREDEAPQPREGQQIRWVEQNRIGEFPLLASDRNFLRYFEKIFSF